MHRSKIFTIGYRHINVATLDKIMTRYEIHYLVDVRSSPWSRSSFGLNSLRLRFKDRYKWCGKTVGGLDEKNRGSDGYNGTLENILGWAEMDKTPVLMCAEVKPEDCHRMYWLSVDLHKLADKQGVNLEINHILGIDRLQFHPKPTTLFDFRGGDAFKAY